MSRNRSGLSVNDIFSLLEESQDDQESHTVIIKGPVENCDAFSDEDSDESDCDVGGDPIHLPRRILDAEGELLSKEDVVEEDLLPEQPSTSKGTTRKRKASATPKMWSKNTSKVGVSHQMIDLILESISTAPFDDLSLFSTSPSEAKTNGTREGVEEFQKVFLSCSNALLALVTHQFHNMIDLIPSFLQQLLRLFRSVVVRGNVEFNPVGGLQGGKLSESLLIMTDCAISIEWISNELVRHKKDFTRVSPYFIADMVCSFEDHIVHPNVKVHLHNCIYVFICFCDSSGLAYLHHALSAGSREIFKSILGNYKKYYKFTGKI